MISVVIILKNDLGIIDTISSLNNQNIRSKFEIVVIDRSTIEYPKISSKIPLRWVKYSSTNKKHTIPEQRNLGISLARGNIIVFFDANCVAEPLWLKNMTTPILHGKEDIVSGLTMSKGGFTLNDHLYSIRGHQKYLQDAATISLAIRKSVFDTVGVFDTDFEYSSDTDFSWRAIDHGYKIYFEPTAVAYHDWGDTKRELRRMILYGKGGARLLIKHRRTRWKLLLGDRVVDILYPSLILLLPIAIKHPSYLLVFPALILKNARNPNPVGIVLKHIVYGCGVIVEVFNQIARQIK